MRDGRSEKENGTQTRPLGPFKGIRGISRVQGFGSGREDATHHLGLKVLDIRSRALGLGNGINSGNYHISVDCIEVTARDPFLHSLPRRQRIVFHYL